MIMSDVLSFDRRALSLAAVLAGATGVAAPGWADGAGSGAVAKSPLEQHYRHQFNFPTGVVLPKGALDTWIGALHTIPGTNTNSTGTGNQFYFGGFQYGIADRFQAGLSYSLFQDPPPKPINGNIPPIRVEVLALSGAYQFVDTGNWKIAAEASIEHALFEGLNGNAADEFRGAIGALNVPISYVPNDQWMFTVTPGVSFLPDKMGGVPLYGTLGYIGAGVNWKPSLRWSAYGSVTVPVTGNNTIRQSGAMDREPVWTVGARYNVSPKTALDFFATNGMGVTPATRALTFFPDGDTTLIGATMTWTPGTGPGYRPNYRGLSGEPLTRRQTDLQLDGFTLSSPDTMTPGTFAVTGFGGSQGSYGGGFKISPDYDFQVEVAYEKRADDGTTGAKVPSTDAAWLVGGSARFMDQNNGSPFSLAVKLLMGRDTSANLNGTFYAGLPMSYKSSSRLAFMAEPKVSAWGQNEFFGFGLGVNFEVANGLNAIAEVTPVAGDADETVWAAGLRYHVPRSPLSLELSASNAIGRYGHGTLIAQDDTKVTLGGTLLFDGRSMKFWN
ncbi:hypothetical protein SAMN04488042_107219 [Shimia aestuarii]|uniref:Uncharacterized protein n=2 Tax=Shimia aestuarii TaxID=254406 RepID=A0A1I4R197_9RHOB|nr:hypothetical protein SAMN04488042_107219 [Shimia aestuarii]